MNKFKLYGTETTDAEQKLLSLLDVSLCFSSAKEMSEFSEFVAECARSFKRDGDSWDHEHYRDEGSCEIIVSRLYKENLD